MIVEVATRVGIKKALKKSTDKLNNQLRKHFARTGVAFLKSFQKFEWNVQESDNVNDIDTLFDNAIPNDKLFELIQQAVEDGLQIGADWSIDEFGLTEYTFDLANPRAVEYTKNYGAELVTKLNDFSRERLREILTQGIDNGWSYGKLATAFRKEFTEFSTKRAKTIAITELGNAYQEGNLIVGKDLSMSGLQIEKSWLTLGDDRVSADCLANEADGWIDVNQAHSSGYERPLDHPNCRCVERYRRVGSNIK